MDKLRKPFFVAALVVIIVTVLVEVGGGKALRAKLVKPAGPMREEFTHVAGVGNHLDEMDPGTLDKLSQSRPPGVGIPFLAFIDGLILFTTGLMGAQFLIGERVQGRIQGVASFIVALLTLLGSVVLIFITVAKLLLMIGLFLAIPFGTLVYLVIWGSFNTSAASATLGVLLTLKLAFAICLVLAHQLFLQNKGLVLIFLTSLLANFVVSFLHALVPSVLVSITDSIAGIVVLILAAIWAVFLLIGSIISIFKAIV